MKWFLGSFLFLIPATISLAQDAAIFNKLDSNGDGQITAAEVPEDKLTAFQRMLGAKDNNSDGQLSKEEFTAALAAEGKRPEGGAGNEKINPAEVLKRFDKNGDGRLSREEAPERMLEHFDRIDANKDSSVDLTEFEQAAAARNVSGGKPPEFDPEKLFTMQDKNKDGKLTPDEVPEERREEFSQALRKLGIEAADKEQFTSMLNALRERGITPGARPNAGGSPPSFSPGGGAPRGPIMQALDNNKDGELSAEEIANASKVLAQLDKNGDGKISGNELLPLGAQSASGNQGSGFNPEEIITRRLKELDKNSDGKIQKSEAQGPLAANFDKADSNSDGELDEAEVRQGLEQLRERLREGGEKVREFIEKKQQ
jgi:Ca2+-binding EF-hand superfamily protein